MFMDSVTVSARIRRDLWEKAKKYGVPTSDVIRRAIEDEVKRREREELRALLEDASRALRRIPPEELVEAVRTTGEER